MQINKFLSNIFTVILIVCAILVSIAVIKREFVDNNTIKNLRFVSNWEKLVKSGQLIGEKNAAIKIIEFTDFRCHYCRNMSISLTKLLKKYKDKISLIVYNFPLNNNRYSFELALGGICASAQNKFKEYYDLIFKISKSKKYNWTEITSRLGIKNKDKFIKCIRSDSVYSVLEKEIKMGKKIGIMGTPTLIINGNMIIGEMPTDELEEIIVEILNNSV